jgi:signal transduction histidine kinase
LIATMVLIVGIIAALAYWDVRRESAAALQDSAEKQAALARALAQLIGIRSTVDPAVRENAILEALGRIGRQDALVLLIHRPSEKSLEAPDGGLFHSPRLIAALNQGIETVRIPKDEAAAFGLPTRIALAGMSRIDRGAFRNWGIVAIATAERERDRESWARRRLVLSVVAAAGLVVAFGGMAMRNQRKELMLERELAIASLQSSRDDRLERANKAAVMGTLAMGVAHELSTPLGVIAARAEQLIARSGDDERAKSSAVAILAQIDRIKLVVRGLLGLARGDVPSAERIDPHVAIQQAISLTEHRFDKAGVWLTQAIEPGLPPVLGDPRLLEHAIVNLLLNACDASNPTDRVIVSARRSGPDVEIVVEDFGSGISAADIGRALEPFFTTKVRGEGTGLGLAIAHEIVASHRGMLLLSPREPRGTSAVIRLPPAGGAADV